MSAMDGHVDVQLRHDPWPHKQDDDWTGGVHMTKTFAVASLIFALAVGFLGGAWFTDTRSGLYVKQMESLRDRAKGIELKQRMIETEVHRIWRLCNERRI